MLAFIVAFNAISLIYIFDLTKLFIVFETRIEYFYYHLWH